MRRLRKHIKDPFSGLSHLFTGLIALVGSYFLLKTTTLGTTKWFGAMIYAITLVLLFFSSAAYHLIRTNRVWQRRLQRVDHAAIFLFIAGSYTPICLFLLSGMWQKILLFVVWVAAFVGVFYKLFFKSSHRWVSVSLYIVMGWLVVFAIKPLYLALPAWGLFWLFFGGLLYTFGAFVYGTKKFDFFPNVFGFHEVWHLFVTAGSTAHFVLISGFVI